MRTHWLLAAAVVVLSTACSDSSPKESVDVAKFGNPIVTPTTAPDIYDVEHSPAMGDYVGALEDISAHTCEQTAGGWRVTASATNPTVSTADYRVYVSLLNSTLVTRALVEAEIMAVAPAASGSFEELIDMPDSDLRCVLRVERRASM